MRRSRKEGVLSSASRPAVVVSLLLTALGVAWYLRRGRTTTGTPDVAGPVAPSSPLPTPQPSSPAAEVSRTTTVSDGARPASRTEVRPPAPKVARSEPLSSEERLALRSVRSLESRGAAPAAADVAEHLGSSTEVAVDGDALGRMLDRFVSEGLVEVQGGGYALTDGGESALTDLDDDTNRTTAEPDAVELHTPGSDAPTADPA